MSSNNTCVNEKGKEQMRTSRWGIYRSRAMRLRRKRRMRSIQKGATARSRNEVLMPRTSKSDGIRFDKPWSLKCACRSCLARKNISVFGKRRQNTEDIICRTKGISSILWSYITLLSVTKLIVQGPWLPLVHLTFRVTAATSLRCALFHTSSYIRRRRQVYC